MEFKFLVGEIARSVATAATFLRSCFAQAFIPGDVPLVACFGAIPRVQ